MPLAQRKLVIFDLNGTLLLRSPSRAGARQIYLRPYARSLVAYLTHPDVRNWLDCMVWSSAQPHNVSQMVDRVFGAGEGAGKGPLLRAVWARDTLGLSRAKFHQKTQTTKDLAKPWGFFAPTNDPTKSAFPTHGPETTLLVDDSPLKARLQPWNHLCVAEYDATSRIRDLDAQVPDSSTSASGAKSQKRKREPSEEEEEEEEEAAATSGEPYDQTLLAVVGVFSHIRSVANVAAWMRSRGLVAIMDGKESESTESEQSDDALPSDPAQWFTSPRLLAAWAERGRAALRELGIDAASAIE
ncbi:hypothetical protein FB45DRAFT_730783 [Roridomyces roridus]|uniref:Mitochondrial import inner membrane translocase subunit TIM50 n=1 Tax=Roridomyces roridus TaxID=1738132 RepID=A0AAD7CID3_9AGAR|nr:hypothetical protein FB45DRAFT_730783 [Roridomyces roridus]